MFSWRNSTARGPESNFTSRGGRRDEGARREEDRCSVGTNLAVECDLHRPDEAGDRKTKGLEVVFDTTDVTPEQQDFTGIADQIKSSGADGVLHGPRRSPGERLSQAIKQAGVDLKAIVFPGGYDDSRGRSSGYEGAYLGIEFKPLEVGSPGLTAYTDAMEAAGFEPQRFFGPGVLRRRRPGERHQGRGRGLPDVQGVHQQPAPRERLRRGRSFVPVDYAEIFGRPFYCVYYVQIQSGSFVPVNDGEPICATKVFEDGKPRKLSKAEQAKG